MNAAVVVAAGRGTRMGAGMNKVLLPVCGVPVIVRSVRALWESGLFDGGIVVVTGEEDRERIGRLLEEAGLRAVLCTGGADRQESVRRGLAALPRETELVAIHDGARPLVSQELITRTIEAARAYRAAVPAVASTDTLKAVDERGFITGTLDRTMTRRVQTPQVFEADLIKGALTKAVELKLTLTDDCSAMDMMGVKTITVEGELTNIKITTPEDMVTAKAIVEDRGDWNANRTWV